MQDDKERLAEIRDELKEIRGRICADSVSPNYLAMCQAITKLNVVLKNKEERRHG